jgi:tetratricopeptide (TPR) repeat protein
MPKGASSNIIHTSVTDHRVPRIPAEARGGRGLPVGAVPLIRFHAGPFSPSRDELDRDLGIALARFTKKPSSRELDTGGFRFLAIDRLKSSLARWPGDAEAWEGLAIARSGSNEANEKLVAARNAVQLAPESETALVALTEVATTAGKFDLANETAEKCIRANPSASHPLMMRAFVALAKRDWDQAEASTRAALRIQPLHPQLHFYLAICLHRKGDPEGGLREAETAARLESDPRESSLLMDSYRHAIR